MTTSSSQDEPQLVLDKYRSSTDRCDYAWYERQGVGGQIQGNKSEPEMYVYVRVYRQQRHSPEYPGPGCELHAKADKQEQARSGDQGFTG